MKAIFAVSALAAAISAQAIAADTEATPTWTGEVEYSSTFDLLNEDRTTGADATGDLSLSFAVTNGGFSGSMNIDHEDGDGVDELEVTIGDLQYEEGAILFGQGIGSIVTTAGHVGNMSSNTDYDAADGFRYTRDALQIQVEAGDTDIDEDGDTDNSLPTDFGLAVAYSTEVAGATIAADAQYREANSPTKGADTMTRPYMGVSADMAVTDMVSVAAGLTVGGEGVDKFLEDDEGGANTTSYGARADVDVMDGVSAHAYYSANVRDGVTDNEAEVGVAAAFGPLSVTATHTMALEAETSETELTADLSEDFAVSEALTVNASAGMVYGIDAADVATTTWDASVRADYAVSEMLTAYAAYMVEEDGDDATDLGTELTAGVKYTTEGGAALTADYTNRNVTFDHDDGETHSVVLKASYSF